MKRQRLHVWLSLIVTAAVLGQLNAQDKQLPPFETPPLSIPKVAVDSTTPAQNNLPTGILASTPSAPGTTNPRTVPLESRPGTGPRIDKAETKVDNEEYGIMALINAVTDKDSYANLEKKDGPLTEKKSTEKKWYEKIQMRGYTQIRTNEVVNHEQGSNRANPQYTGDGSIGQNRNFFIRRARIIFFGDISEHLYVYMQPDFASSVPGSTDANHFAQIRDFYADVYIDKEKVHRLRIGQSKIPYGWENMQSSQNRLPLDRADALNSAARNERDLGVFYYYTPQLVQERFKDIQDKGLKHSGNYGMFALGVYNGTGGSLQEQNENLHAIARINYPFQFDNGQYMELALQGFYGRYAVLGTSIRPLVGETGFPLGTVENNGRPGIRDTRVAGTFVYYPQPFGVQVEWTYGEGPALNEQQNRVTARTLHGGYIMSMYKFDDTAYGTFIPFGRWSYFLGGYRSERNAPYTRINEFEVGCEWQIRKEMELTLSWLPTSRTNTTDTASTTSTGSRRANYRPFVGDVLRVQFQFNY